MSSKEELLRLLEPPADKWPLPSPDEIVRAYGSALPADYMWLAETYGPGEIAGLLYLLPPLTAAEIGKSSGVCRFTGRNSEYDWENEGLDPAYLEPGALLMWAADYNNDNYVFWQPVGDPDEWPVVVYRLVAMPGPNWLRYDVGAVEFLVGTFRGRLSRDPFDGGLWRNESPTFMRE